jgi:hypothetical protein
METNRTESEKFSRREALKKAGKVAAFIAPTLLTFNLSETRVYASGLPNPPAPPWR